MADSLIKYTLGSKQKLSENQYKDLSTIISNYYNQSIKIQEQYQSKLSRDSLQLNAERILLEGQTKAMIDLHLTKIDHEYNNITMWAAILTILFLVFSFYSIFKMDELIQQGREGVKDIKRLKKEGDDSITCVKTENNEQIKKLKEETEELANGVYDVFWGWSDDKIIPKGELQMALKNAKKLVMAIEKLIEMTGEQ